MITHDVDEAVLLSDRIVMMTNGPSATIGEILDVQLPRPRDRLALAESPDFNHARQQVLKFLYAKQRNPALPKEEPVQEDTVANKSTTLRAVNDTEAA
jgi:nitrate/nitrite transport system ATP-binding protein